MRTWNSADLILVTLHTETSGVLGVAKKTLGKQFTVSILISSWLHPSVPMRVLRPSGEARMISAELNLVNKFSVFLATPIPTLQFL